MAGPASSVVSAGNLGADFDLGTQVASKINIVTASTTRSCKAQFSTTAQAQAATALLALDAPTLIAAMSSFMTAWLATLPTTPQTPGSGTWWNNAGVPTQA